MANQSSFWTYGGFGAAVCLQCVLVGAAVAGGPAVSTPNGSLDLRLGTGSNSTLIYGAGGTFSVPAGDNLGIQADFGVQNYDLLTGTAALHVFTRDPSTYLVGVTAGIVRSNVASLSAIGAEGELYIDRLTIGGWAGYAYLNYDLPAAPDKSGLFATGEVSFYPTDDLRLSLGASSILGYKSVGIGAEFHPPGLDLPLSMTADARYGEDGRYSATAGVKVYFGDPGKSLLARNREDDPPDRGLDLFVAAGTQATQRPAVAGDFTTQQACEDAGFTWFFGSPEYCG